MSVCIDQPIGLDGFLNIINNQRLIYKSIYTIKRDENDVVDFPDLINKSFCTRTECKFEEKFIEQYMSIRRLAAIGKITRWYRLLCDKPEKPIGKQGVVNIYLKQNKAYKRHVVAIDWGFKAKSYADLANTIFSVLSFKKRRCAKIINLLFLEWFHRPGGIYERITCKTFGKRKYQSIAQTKMCLKDLCYCKPRFRFPDDFLNTIPFPS